MADLALLGGAPVRATTLPYARQALDADDTAAVVDALGGAWITQGPCVARFEQALAAALGARHAVAVASGTAGLHAAYRAAEIGPGQDVVTTPLTFAATTNALVDLGARPVFADIEADTLNIGPDAIARVLTPETRAVVPVDFAGLPCDYAPIAALARARGARLIADAAHSLGAAYAGRPVGTLADLTVLSFHPAKQITSGEGGAVITDDPALAERLRRIRHHGIRHGDPDRPWRYDIEQPGGNYRLTDFQAALGTSQLAKLARFGEARDRLARRYRARLAGAPELELPGLPDGRRHGWHLFVVLLRLERLTTDRDTVIRALRAEGIGATMHYPLVPRHRFYRERFGYAPGLCPVAEAVERRLVTLPLFPTMTDADQDDVFDALDKVMRYFAR
jgi:dTDP-4-amino-4,6-dideoxygalactose transaminase